MESAKSLMCSHAPRPIFVGAEKGTEQLDVARFPKTETISELFGQLRALQTEKHEFNTVVLDSLDWIEPLIWKAVCQEGKVETIEQYAGGYGKGYVRALDIWRTLIRELSALNEKMHVLLIGHALIKSFQDPELPTAYDRYQLKINDKAAALVREAADAVPFARFETELVRDNGSKAKVRGEGNRIMYTESRPGWDAKNRFNLPFCMPLCWKTFGDAIRAFYGLCISPFSNPTMSV
jgi:AAA domain